MSIIDKNIRMSTAQAVTATAYTTDDLDFASIRDMWAGKPLHFKISPATQLTSGGASTIDFRLLATTKPLKITDATAVTVSNGTPGVFTLAAHSFVAGTEVYLASGTPPTGGSPAWANGTVYYVCNDANLTANTFALSNSLALALAGTARPTTSTGTSVTLSQYTVMIASTGAIPYGGICPGADSQGWRPVILTPDTAIGAIGLRSAALSQGAGAQMRYLRGIYVVATANLTGGTFNWDLVDTVDDAFKFYPTGSPF